MGQVWAARPYGLRGYQRLVAIKTILPSGEDPGKLEAMLLAEATLASRIRHPNVVEAFEIGQHERTLYFVMEWVSGEPLDVVMREASKKGGVPLGVAVQVITQACRGLQAAHEARDDLGRPLGIVHRDISPQNLLVTYSGMVKLADFGVAKATERTSQPTFAGELKGKFSYMAPEQVRGGAVDARTDIFAMGVVLYRLATHRHPFKGQDPTETLTRILAPEPPPRPVQFVRGLPPALDAAIMRAIDKDPDARFPSARAMIAELERALPDALASREERDIESLMHRAFGSRIADRARALKSAVDFANEAKQAQALLSAGRNVPRSQSTMRAVEITTGDSVSVVLPLKGGKRPTSTMPTEEGAKRSSRGWRRAPYALAVGAAFLSALLAAPAAHVRLPWPALASLIGGQAAFEPGARLPERAAALAPAPAQAPVDLATVDAGAKADSATVRERAAEGAPAHSN
jgi:serine/threonine-protein kinase